MFLLAGCSALLTPKVERAFSLLKDGQYTLDSSHTSVLFKVQHMGLSTYVGRFNEFSAQLNFDPENKHATAISAEIPVASIDVNNDFLRDTLLKDDWFDEENFKTIKFKSTKAESGQTDNQLRVFGELLLKGKVMPIELISTFHGGAFNLLTGHYTIGFSGSTTINRSDFGIDSYLGLVGDKVDIEIHAEFQKQD